MFKNPEDNEIRSIMQKSVSIAIVGLSGNRDKDSNLVARYLQEKGYRIIPVNPGEAEILGLKSYPDLISIPEKIDIVNVFRRSEHLPSVVEEALKVGTGCIWAQLGVAEEGSAARAASRGITVVMNLCIKNEHKRLLANNHEKQ